MSQTRWTPIYLTIAVIMGAILAFLLWAVPVDEDGVRDWTGQLIPGFWMAWTFPVALFFWCIAALLIIMTLLAIRFPETPRVGILRIETTRGDRAFHHPSGHSLHPLGLALLRRPRRTLGRDDPIPRLYLRGLPLGVAEGSDDPGPGSRTGQDQRKRLNSGRNHNETTFHRNGHGARAHGHAGPRLGRHRGGESLP